MANYGPQATESAIISPLRDHTRESVATVDQDRFRAIYDQYVRAIYQYCYRRLPTIEDAEDATSLIFEGHVFAVATARR
jgi:hypothetical protein